MRPPQGREVVLLSRSLHLGVVAAHSESASGSGRCEEWTRVGMPGADVCMVDMAHPLGEGGVPHLRILQMCENASSVSLHC